MPDYQEGKIYKIYNTVNDEIYIGSTTRKLCERMADHRRRINGRDQNFPIYKAFRDHGIDNFFIELIEKYPCNDIDELRKKEGEYIKELKPCLNRRVPGRSKADYYNENRSTELQKMRVYRESNKEAINEQKKQYRENNKEYIKSWKGENIACECGRIVTRGCLSRHRKSQKHIKLMNELN